MPPPEERISTRWKGVINNTFTIRIKQDPPDPPDTMKGGLKLHLGCGPQNWDGFVDIDAYPNWMSRPDMVADITKLPYKHGTVDEIWLIHVFEHIHIWQAEDALYHWHNILKPGGRLVVEVPCMDKILDNFKKKEVSPALTFFGIFGEQMYGRPEMCHKWCYSRKQLRGLMIEAGFSYAEVKKPIYHRPNRDMRVEGVK